MNLSLQIQELRDIVEFAANSAEAGARHCPECNQRVFVHTGKRTGVSWFTHEFTSDCINDDPRRRILFYATEKLTSREIALAAEKIFTTREEVKL